jgi:hypothetical protein
LHLRLRGAYASQCLLQAGIVFEGCGDELIELRIAVLLPPTLFDSRRDVSAEPGCCIN